VTPARHAAYARLLRALEGDAPSGLTDEDRELLGAIARDVFRSADARGADAPGSCQAGAALLAGLVQAGRLDQAEAAGLWGDLCECGAPGAWRPFAAVLALAALDRLPRAEGASSV
jgi:hypothetical protein